MARKRQTRAIDWGRKLERENYGVIGEKREKREREERGERREERREKRRSKHGKNRPRSSSKRS